MGLMLAETAYRHQIQIMIEPFKGLLISVFFPAIGMQIAPHAIAREPLWIGASALGSYAIKAAIATAFVRATNRAWGAAADRVVARSG